jgi:hypothetical protein
MLHRQGLRYPFVGGPPVSITDRCPYFDEDYLSPTMHSLSLRSHIRPESQTFRRTITCLKCLTSSLYVGPLLMVHATHAKVLAAAIAASIRNASLKQSGPTQLVGSPWAAAALS